MATHVRYDVLVLGGGPAGLVAAIRAGDLGARTALVTRDAFGGMAALDGPIPVRTLAHAARLVRDARQLGRYGIAVSDPVLDYPRLLTRVKEVVDEARAHAVFRRQVDAAGVTVHEHAGMAHFADAYTVETQSGLRIRAEKIVPLIPTIVAGCGAFEIEGQALTVSWTTIGKGKLVLQANFGDTPATSLGGEVLFSTHAADHRQLAAWEVRLLSVVS